MKILIEESVLRQALDALELSKPTMVCAYQDSDTRYATKKSNEAITALRTALDAAEKVEPVVWIDQWYLDNRHHSPSVTYKQSAPSQHPLYLHPSNDEKLRKRIDLYEKALKASWPDGAKGDPFDCWNAARAAEGEK